MTTQKQVLYSIIAVVVLFAGLFGVYQLVGGGGQDAAVMAQIKAERPLNRTLWAAKAPHSLVVFSDFQCPACKLFDEYLSTFEATSSPQFAITKKVALVFRYFPLYQIHEFAYPLAYAAEAAGRQGKFEQMATRMFADQEKFADIKDINVYIKGIATDLSLDVPRLQKDINDPSLQQVVQNDLQLGEKVGINATPTFFLDGEKLENATPQSLLEALKKL